MKMEQLECYGIQKPIIGLWENSYGKELLPLQVRAIQEFKVLEGNNLVVMAATSSGKTLVGEIAGLQRCCRKEKVIYAVPLKSLAEEKYHQFKTNYGPYGIRTLVSHRDRREFDHQIEQGYFDIAVIVYEKLQGLLVRYPELLREVKLVVIDELQMLGDEQRGADLEMLLTQLKLISKTHVEQGDAPIQLIGLSAVLGNASAIAGWLDADLLQHETRPVELRRGILYNNLFEYVEYNTGKIGNEFLVSQNGDTDDFTSLQDPSVAVYSSDPYHTEKVLQTARVLAQEKNESTIIFVPTKWMSRQWAQWLSEHSTLAPATHTLEQLADMDESASREILHGLLQHGIAYHNGDLSMELRAIVESGFQSGEIRILVATGTLGQGLNLAAKNTIIIPEIYKYSRKTGGFLSYSIPLSQLENQGGRAGRFGYTTDYGRLILVAESEHERMMLFTRYISAYVEPTVAPFKMPAFESIRPALSEQSWETPVLRLVASGWCRDTKGLMGYFSQSYSAEKLKCDIETGGDSISERIHATLQSLQQRGYVSYYPDGIVKSTQTGYLCASTGIRTESMDVLKNWMHRLDRESLHPLEILMLLSFTPDALELRVPVRESEIRTNLPMILLNRKMADIGLDPLRIIQPLLEEILVAPKDKLIAVKKSLALLDWLSDKTSFEIEHQHNLFISNVQSLASDYAWLLRAFAMLGIIRGWREDKMKSIELWSDQLCYGVTEQGLPLAKVHLDGLHRNQISRLNREGITTLEELCEIDISDLVAWLGNKTAHRVWKAAHPEDASAGAVLQLKQDYATDKLELCGVPVKRRTLIQINHKNLELANSSYLVLLKLARACLAAQNNNANSSWVHRDTLDNSDHWRAISRLRTELNPFLADNKEPLIENDGNGYYRLRMYPEHLSINETAHTQHWNHCFHLPAESVDTHHPHQPRCKISA